MPRSRYLSRRAPEAQAETPIQTPAEEKPTNANTANDDEAVGSENSAPAQARTRAGRRAGSYVWTVPAQLFLIWQLKAAVREGERAEAGFHKRVWDHIIQRFPIEGLAPVTKQQLKNKFDAWKAKWKLFEALAQQSAWGVVDDTLVATEEQWDRALHTYGRKAVMLLRDKPLKYRAELNEIFDRTTANGDHARVSGARDSEVLDEEADDLIDEVVRPQFDRFGDIFTENGSQQATSLPTTPEPLSRSNALKRKFQASPSSSSSERSLSVDDDFAMLAVVLAVVLAEDIAEMNHNVPGGKAKEAAIDTFQTVYGSLDNRDFTTMLVCFNNPQNVITFNALGPGSVRDAWVRHIIDKNLSTVWAI